MMWLTWRQFRAQAIAAAAGLAAVAVTLAITGIRMISQYNADGLGTCHASCTSQATTFLNEVRNGPDHLLFYGALLLMYLIPALIGIFWGAPLIGRELEAGTHRLAWNQSISRTRWTVMKLGLIGLAAMATAGLLSLMISWWGSPIDSAVNYGQPGSGAFPRINPLVFGARGVAPLGYAAFAFALGVTAGVIIRRTLPAMAVTLAVFAAVALVMPIFVRQHLIPPVQQTAPFNAYQASDFEVSGLGSQVKLVGNFSRPGAWILSNETISPSGKLFTGPVGPACTGTNSTQNACNNSINALHLRQLVSYQPANRFWPLQFLETGIYLVLAAGLGWLCVWRVRNRRV